MAKIYSGTYGKDTTDETALVTNLLKYPEIGKKIISQYPRFSLTYLLEAAGRNAAEKVIGDYAFEWKMMGRYRKPCTINSASNAATGVAAGSTFTITFDHDTANGTYGNTLNVNDVVRFHDGTTAMVVNGGTPGALTNVVTFRSIDTSTSTVFATGDIVGPIGSAFNQGSLGSEVGQNYAYPDTYKNWLTLSRKKTKIMGSDLTDVTWIESNGHRLWYFTKEQQMTDQFMYELECMRWYGKKSNTMTSASYPGDTGLDDVASNFVSGIPIMGDGLLAQIDSANQATYTAGALTEEDIVNFIGTLSKNALNAEGNVFTVFTGTQGRIDFHRAMKDLLVNLGSGTPVFAGKGGGDVALGANFQEYNVLGNKMILSYCPVFDDPNLHNSISSDFSSSNESGKMVFLDMGMQNGVSNVELIAKGAEGFNRSFVKKYVPGMVNPYDYNSMMAANGDDFFECQILSESGIILRNPLSCGILSNS